MPGKRKVAAKQAPWPENLRQKYRKLALPAVVAAVSAKKGKAAGEEREPRDTEEKKRR
jgi:hypothetical protein